MTNETQEEAVAPQDGMTIDEVATDAKRSAATVRRWVAREKNPLPSYMLGGQRLVRRAKYREWLAVDAHDGGDGSTGRMSTFGVDDGDDA